MYVTLLLNNKREGFYESRAAALVAYGRLYNYCPMDHPWACFSCGIEHSLP